MASKKVAGYGVVDRIDSGCIGCMGRETPFIDVAMDSGEKYRWWSDEVDRFWGKVQSGDAVFVEAFIRESTGRLFKVSLKKVSYKPFCE